MKGFKMATSDLKQVLRRDNQLNTIAYAIIVALLGMVVALLIPLVSGLKVPGLEVVGNQIAQTLFVGTLLMFIIYLFDQHRRLRGELLDTHNRLERANTEISSAYDRLSFAQHTASVMTSLTVPNALERILEDASTHFGADAAAVVGEDITLISNESVDSGNAESAVLQVALDVVRAGKAMSTSEHAQGGEAIAVPLRIQGELKSVICLWRQTGAFQTDQLEGLILMARIIELSLENRILLQEVKDQLNGTLSVLSSLIDQRLPDYARHSTRMAEQAVAVGRSIGLSHKDLTDLRISALLADVGMLQVPQEALATIHELGAEETTAVRQHPVGGADVAKHAYFSTNVQDAIHAHHERLDGSGYPRGRKGDGIPVAARILAVCDAYDSMTSPRPGRNRQTPTQAVSALMREAGTAYDAEVVRAFMQVVGHDVSGISGRPRSGADAPVAPRTQRASERISH